MVQVPVFFGEWVMRDWKWHFEVDHPKGGRMFFLSDVCTQHELIEMARDEYQLDKNTELIDLTYSLPESMLPKMEKDSPTPPIHITNDRQVRSFVELSKIHVVSLCVSSRIGMASGNNDEECDVDEESEEDAEECEDEDTDMSDCGDSIGKDGEGIGNVVDNEATMESPASVFEQEEFADYSAYGKVKDENGSEDDDDDTCLGGKGSFVGGGRRSNMAWSDGIYVNASFPSRDALVSELRLTAIMCKFAYKVLKSKKALFVATCRVKGCNWRVRAATKNEPDTFWVTKYLNVHTCSVSDRMSLRKRYSPKYIGKMAYDELGTVDEVTPKLIRSTLKKHGIKMDYTTSYRALIYAQQLVRGTAEDGYDQLPSYLYHITLSNPGTVTDLVVDDENRFKYLFLAFGSSISGFQYLRRVIVVDGCHLTGKYGGVLLVATGQDANFQIFPLAFAIVDSENDESWEWFFTKLRGCVSDQGPLVIVSDRHASIKKACETVFPFATRGICYYHLQNNIVTKYKGKHLLYLVKGAAYAYTHYDFNRYMDAIRRTKPELADYLETADVKLWARVHFPGDRYNIQTSNIAESINSALKIARGFPIQFLLDFIREKLGRWYFKRREDAMSLTTKHSRGVEYLLTIREHYADKMTVERIDGWRFYVRGGHRDCIIDFLQRKCQCGVYDVEKIPCSHAIAAAPELQMEFSSLVCPSYTKEYLYAAYSGNIYPKFIGLKSPEFVKVLPPPVKRLPGRQKKSRWQTWLEIAKKVKDKPRNAHKQYNCSKCKQPGHTRPKCVSSTHLI